MSQQATRTEETKSENQTIPVSFFVFLALSLFGGAIYVDSHGGGFHKQVYAPYRDFDYVKSIQPSTGSGPDPAPIYKLYCAVCHQDTGLGVPGQFPPLAGSDWVLAEGPNRIIRVVLHGGQPPMVVNGVTYGALAMPPWKDSLKDEEIAAVLTYIRSSWGNKASPVKASQVKAIREKEASRGLPWNGAELLTVPDKD
jgi:mono/diheme cytochrome c family protein